MIPAGNEIYSIVTYDEEIYIHHFENVISISTKSGGQVTFTSPMMNISFRKMIYFITNKKFLKPKTGLILPFIQDNFIYFNRRENITQFCNFFEYRDPVTLT